MYVTFLTPIVQEYEAVNASFQSSSPDVDLLHSNLTVLYKCTRGRLYESILGRDKIKHVKVRNALIRS